MDICCHYDIRFVNSESQRNWTWGLWPELTVIWPWVTPPAPSTTLYCWKCFSHTPQQLSDQNSRAGQRWLSEDLANCNFKMTLHFIIPLHPCSDDFSDSNAGMGTRKFGLRVGLARDGYMSCVQSLHASASWSEWRVSKRQGFSTVMSTLNVGGGKVGPLI